MFVCKFCKINAIWLKSFVSFNGELIYMCITDEIGSQQSSSDVSNMVLNMGVYLGFNAKFAILGLEGFNVMCANETSFKT